MISYLKGQVLHKDDKFIILNVNGVGYKVFCCLNFLGGMLEGTDAEMFTHLHIREDLLDLYGFSSIELLKIFELLISVSGVGPKAGLNIMNMVDISVLVSAIRNKDVKIFTSVSGIGKKIAEKIILELGDKINKINFDVKDISSSDSSDLIEALVSMGYSSFTASKILSELPKEGTLEEKLKVALRMLAR